MNRSIVRLFGVVILLFTALIVWTSRWTVFDASALNSNPLNRLSFYASLKVRRGTIYADNGSVLARSTKAAGGTWKRSYPQGSLFAQTVGYVNPQQGQYAGLEQSFNHYLEGAPNALTSVFGSFNGTPKVGDDVYTTLDPKAQAEARTLLAGRVGSVVAIVPQTGAVKVMYSNPTYDDNNPSACATTPGCSEYFNATQGGYPPGSTFKLVTSTAALDSRKFTPQSTIAGPSPLMVSGQPLHNDGNQSWPASTTLTTALTYSINTIYAQVGQRVGAQTMQEYMQRYGFYSEPPLDYPSSQMRASGERNQSTGALLLPTHPCNTNAGCVDLGRMSIGQDKLAVTPLQMAMVVSTIANNGTLMKPRLVSKVVNQEGQTVAGGSPQVYSQVMKPKYAAQLTKMMEDVVEEGTGTAANVEGLKVAGKTGTASTYTKNGVPYDDAWFVGFPVNDPKIAVAVELTDLPNGYGGVYAAPIAAQVIKTLLAENR